MAAKSKSKTVHGTPAMRSGNCKDMDMNIRKIENGFIVRHSMTDGKGNYKSTEFYSKTNPIGGMKFGGKK